MSDGRKRREEEERRERSITLTRWRTYRPRTSPSPFLMRCVRRLLTLEGALVLRFSGFSQQRVDRFRMAVAAM